MKILHIASFNGNIGDNASHIGFYKILNAYLDNFELNQIEIRKFYKNYKKSDALSFDNAFIELMNSYDLCLIGGGGFLDYWVPNSMTGTTIDIDPMLIHKINTPTLFTSIGSNPHKIIPSNNIKKYKLFLEKACANNNIKFAFRNDGSIESLKRDVGVINDSCFNEILDHGFFYDVDKEYEPIVKGKYVAINITEDQLEMQSQNRGKIDKPNYYKELSQVLNHIVFNLNLQIILVPHIYSDLNAISSLLNFLDDDIIRNYVSVAPCIQGDFGTNRLFSIYKKSEFVIASRFHANVCSLAMGKKTIGIAVLDRVKYLYEYLGIPNNAINIESSFGLEIIKIIDSTIPKSKLFLKKINETNSFYKIFFKGLKVV